MGYDWKGWSILFYILAATFTALQVIDPVDYGIPLMVHKWIILVLGIGMSVAAKLGASWLDKSPTS